MKAAVPNVNLAAVIIYTADTACRCLHCPEAVFIVPASKLAARIVHRDNVLIVAGRDLWPASALQSRKWLLSMNYSYRSALCTVYFMHIKSNKPKYTCISVFNELLKCCQCMRVFIGADVVVVRRARICISQSAVELDI